MLSRYAVVLIASVFIPLMVSFWPPLKFYKNIPALLKTITCILFLFGAWDAGATHRGHWSFNPQGVASLRVLNLPLEEVLFFVVIPFCCIFTWEVLGYIKIRKHS